MKWQIIAITAILGLIPAKSGAQAHALPGPRPPIRLAIIGLEHGHARAFLPKALTHEDITVVGIVEPDRELVAKYVTRFHLPTTLFVDSIEALCRRGPVEAVAVFTNTFEHRRVVESCAERHIHVMMEKPLAINMEHARAIAEAAAKGGIHIVVNYETTWYPANLAAQTMVNQGKVGDIRKLVVHAGHRGPKLTGSPPEFVRWLTDPALSGGGALIDFGCYGANLITWLMREERPQSVMALCQTNQPDNYPRVEDEATIVVSYPRAQGIIEASWNWPFARKDLEVYGSAGTVMVPRGEVLRMRGAGMDADIESVLQASAEPLAHFAAVVRGEVQPNALSGLKNNLIVTEILDAARESARTGRKVDLPKSLGAPTR